MCGMEHVSEIKAVRERVAAARRSGRRIGLVPTMGYLHAGHMSLVEASVADGLYTVVSIFVNPTQFGPNDDLDRYPRDTEGDLKKCADAGVELVFLPAGDEMYRPDASTSVQVRKLTDTLCGPARPGHFDGVATVVTKLFNIVQPDRAYFGQKDFQQLAVIRRMVRDLDMPVEVVGCPIVRQPDGLAMSSRNVLLNGDEHGRALRLHEALCHARDRIGVGERDPVTLTTEMLDILAAAEPRGIDYVSIVDPETLQPVLRIERAVLIALAVRLGPTRLIDNMVVDPHAAGT